MQTGHSASPGASQAYEPAQGNRAAPKCLGLRIEVLAVSAEDELALPLTLDGKPGNLPRWPRIPSPSPLIHPVRLAVRGQKFSVNIQVPASNPVHGSVECDHGLLLNAVAATIENDRTEFVRPGTAEGSARTHAFDRSVIR
jgi:hypothetical protein